MDRYELAAQASSKIYDIDKRGRLDVYMLTARDFDLRLDMLTLARGIGCSLGDVKRLLRWRVAQRWSLGKEQDCWRAVYEGVPFDDKTVLQELESGEFTF